MQSIDDLARAITELYPSELQALLDEVAKLNGQQGPGNGTDINFDAMKEAMNDQLFLDDLRGVMGDSR